MSRNASFRRKVIYIAAIALLLIPIAAMSQPEAASRKGFEPGGTLATLRRQHNLSQANLGEIDPASETMKLATLGLRGVAANILWSHANHYKKHEDWDNLEATVQQIIRLQPNFLQVWDFQAHNLSYNVSVEFDDYRFRYEWVKKGIDFLMLGTQYNHDEPGLLYSLGWYTGQKIGRSDESKQFRSLFREDDDFHAEFRRHGIEVDQDEARGPDGKPDNWLVARLWYLKGVDAHVRSDKPIRGKSPLLFYSGAPMSQINGAAAMQKDGFFRQRAQLAWQRAADGWKSYGNIPIATSAGFPIQLNDLERLRKEIEDINSEIDTLAPGVRQKLRDERMASLTDEERQWVGRSSEAKTVDEYETAIEAEIKATVTNDEVAREAPPEVRKAIREKIEKIERASEYAKFTEMYRNIVNFEYWRTRCEAEATDIAQQAHSDLYRAEQLRESGEHFQEAKQKYADSFAAWAKIFDEFPALMDNAEAQDLIDAIENYHELLGHLEEEFPADFPLNTFLNRHDTGRKLLEQVKLLSDTPATLPEQAPDDKPPSDDKTPDSPQSNDSQPQEEDMPAKTAEDETVAEDDSK